MAGFAESSRTSIVKLNSNNYHLWKFGAEMLLLKEDLWETVTQGRPEKVTDDWIKKDNNARATIALSVEASLHNMISSCTSSKEMWTKIKLHFERASYSSKIFLKRKLYATKLEKNDMEGYISQILGIVERLRLAGETITDKEVISMMLCGLSEEYDGLIMAIEGRNEEDIGLDNIKLKLIDEAKRKNEKLNMYMENQQAMATNQYRPPRLCYECRSPGHIRINCPRIKTQNKRSEGAINNRRPYNNNETNFTAGIDEKPEEVNENYYSYISTYENVLGVTTNKNTWILDSGATTHMCNNIELIDEYVAYKTGKDVTFANGDKSEARGKGELNYIFSNNYIKGIALGEVIYVPNVIANLLSVPELCREGFEVSFSKNTCEITNSGEVILFGTKNKGIYEVTLETKTTNSVMTACIHRWHARMGHRSLNGIMKLNGTCAVKGLKIEKCAHVDNCIICDKTKLCQKPYEKNHDDKTKEPFYLLHSDLCGPIVPESRGGGSYFVTIIDDYSRYCYLKVIRNKSETSSIIKNFIDHYYNKFKHHPMFLRSDCGGEYGGQDLDNYLKDRGIVHQNSIAYHHEQNGLSERINRTLINMTKSIISHHNLDKRLWGEAVSTPYKKWTGKYPNVEHLRIIGSKVIYWVPKQLRSKLSDSGKEGVLLGYGDTVKGYRILDVESDKIIYSRTVRFNEENTCSNEKPNDSYEELEVFFPRNNTNTGSSEKPRRSSRSNLGKKPARYEE